MVNVKEVDFLKSPKPIKNIFGLIFPKIVLGKSVFLSSIDVLTSFITDEVVDKSVFFLLLKYSYL